MSLPYLSSEELKKTKMLDLKDFLAQAGVSTKGLRSKADFVSRYEENMERPKRSRGKRGDRLAGGDRGGADTDDSSDESNDSGSEDAGKSDDSDTDDSSDTESDATPTKAPSSSATHRTDLASRLNLPKVTMRTLLPAPSTRLSRPQPNSPVFKSFGPKFVRRDEAPERRAPPVRKEPIPKPVKNTSPTKQTTTPKQTTKQTTTKKESGVVISTEDRPASFALKKPTDKKMGALLSLSPNVIVDRYLPLSQVKGFRKKELSPIGSDEPGPPLPGSCFATTIGLRDENEDTAVAVDIEPGLRIYGVFDGHSGAKAAELAKKYLPYYIANAAVENRKRKMEDSLVQAFLDFDVYLFREGLASDKEQEASGCTATVVVVDRGDVYVANLGDSRTLVFGKNGRVFVETRDHKANDEFEWKRITSLGGIVYKPSAHDIYRVSGNLAVARAFGDFVPGLKLVDGKYGALSAYVSAVPEIYAWNVGRGDTEVYVLMASDGLWDAMGTRDVVQSSLSTPKGKSTCQHLVDLALARGTTDNTTVFALKL